MKKRKLIAGVILALVLVSQTAIFCTAESSISGEIIVDLDAQESLPVSEPDATADPAGNPDTSGTAADILPEEVIDSAPQETPPISGTNAAAEAETVIDLESADNGSAEEIPYDETAHIGETYGGESSDESPLSSESISINLENETDLTIEAEELSTDSLELENYPAAPASSYFKDLPDYDVWMANTMINGFEGGPSPYSTFQNAPDPVYRELGGYVLDDTVLSTLSAGWSVLFNSEYQKQFANEPKYIYEVILMNYLKYDAEEGNASSSLESNEIKFSTELGAALVDELNENSSDYIDGMTKEQASSFLFQIDMLKDCKDLISLEKDIAEDTEELIQIISDYLALQKAKEERIALLQAARDACGSSNSDFAAAADDIIKILQGTEIEYAVGQMGDLAWNFFFDNAWSMLEDTYPVLKTVELGISGLDACFDSTNKASNNLKLALLYTVDYYMKQGMQNSASAFSRSQTAENGQNFLACFQAYDQFQIYGNTYARTWLEDYLDSGVISDFINMLFYRDNISTAKELIDRVDSQTNTRVQILELFNKYAGVYETLYNNFKIVTPVPVTGVRFSSSSLTLYEDDLLPVGAEVIPKNAANKNVTYTSSNTSVITVPSKGGLATIKGPGAAVITVRTEDGGFTATMTVTVKKKGTSGSSSVVSKEGICGKNGENVKWKLYEDGFLYIYGEGDAVHAHEFNDDYVTKVVVSDKITSFGNGFFYGCSNLTEISLSDDLTSIGPNAFSGCSRLTEINFPDGLTSIESNAFLGCSSLKEIKLPNSLASIGYRAFHNCSSLKEIKFSDSLTSIGEEAFGGCSSLKEIKLPNSLASIGENAFEDCSSLTKIEFPDSLTSIGEEAFGGCSSLKEINFPDGLTSIGAGAFSDCSSLKEINFPDGLTSIEERAFSGCSSLKEINFPDGLTSIGWGAFSGCSSLTEIKLPDNLTSIGDYAFSGCSSLTEIKFPNSLTSIEERAFSGCSSLKEIKLPDSLTSIGEKAFYECSSLKEIKLPDSLTSIGEKSFCSCSSLKEIKLPDNLASINDSAFEKCSSLKEIKFPDSLIFIGKDAFNGCHGLKKIVFTGNVLDIGLKEIVSTGGNALEISYIYDAFNGVTAVAIYPADNPTWTKDKMKDYGGKLTWIPDKDLSLKNCKITLPFFVLCTGKKLTPAITVENGTTVLEKGTDYTLTFTNNKNPGKATVTIKGKGLYTGKVKKTFEIRPADPGLTATRVTGRNSVKLTWKKVAGASGYVIQRKSKGKWVTRKTITKGTTTTYTDTSAKKGTAWNYRICAYGKSGEKKICSSWSTAKSKK